VVAVPTVVGFLEQATRVKRELILILAEAVEEEKKVFSGDPGGVQGRCRRGSG